MAVHIVQLGSDRRPGEGLRIGTVRRPPRGVPRAEFARRNFYDVWLPDLSPSTEVIAEYHGSAQDEAAWKRLERRYRREMKEPEKTRMLELLAALSRTASFSVGCYCDDERRCNRSILRSMLKERGADVT